MDLKAAVEAAKKKGMRLPKVDEPFVKPAKSSRDWQNHPDGGGRLGMNAARAAEGTSNKVHSHYIVKAASLASIGLMALSLLVLDATVKFHVVSYQIETGNGFRSYALLSGASLLRALAGVSLLRDGYDACEALCRMFWYMFKGMDEVERSPGMQPISKGKALQIVFSVTLRFAETIFAGNDDAMSVVYEQDLSITQALQALEDFWNSMNKASSKDAVVSIFGASFKMCQNGAVPMLMISQCGWCPETGWPVLAAAACFVSYQEIKMEGMARLAVSELHRFVSYCRIVHCGFSGQVPAGVDVTRYLLDLARRIPYMCTDKIFGLDGHTNVNLGSTVCMVPLLGASDERDFLMGAGVGVFQTLPLHRDKVWRAIYDLLKRAPFITGDHGIYKVLFGPEQKWKPGPGL